ncbi:MAG TPA: lysophospholipid acyltransferase family protein [Longimicrobiaceae bacterium]|nr:lysophospholipid acyltransferase family protein [Longimicrobiaceae bacterium]
MSPEQIRSPRFLAAARWYVRRELARALDGLHVGGLEAARELCRAHPVLLVSNHVCWWDPLVVLALDEALGTEGYALMDAENLCGVPFFARFGAIPLDRRSAPRMRAGLRAAAALLDRPGRALWIFPQGRHRPAHLRPLGFQPGVLLLARLAPRAQLLPVALQYAYAEGHNPAVFASFGEPVSASHAARAEDARCLEARVAAALGSIDRVLAGEAPPFPALIPSRVRRPDRGFGSRMLAWTTGRGLRTEARREHG